jgi:hypothetical protein
MPGKAMGLVTNKQTHGEEVELESTLATPITQYTKVLNPPPLPSHTALRLYNSPPKGKGKALRACVCHAFKRSSPNLKSVVTQPTFKRSQHL